MVYPTVPGEYGGLECAELGCGTGVVVEGPFVITEPGICCWLAGVGAV